MTLGVLVFPTTIAFAGGDREVQSPDPRPIDSGAPPTGGPVGDRSNVEWGVHDGSYDLAAARELFRSLNMQTFRSDIPAIDFQTELITGESVALSDLAGSFVFLNFWATWCPPCREEMPSMERLNNAFGGQSFEMLAVNVQEAAGAVRAFVDEFDYTFPVALDERGFAATQYGVRGIPTTVIVGPDGVIVAQLMGTRYWDEPEVFDAFEALLKNASS